MPVNTVLGIAKKYLLENFSNFPIAHENFLNGHILYIFASKRDKSRARTKRELLSLLPSDSSISYLPINAAVQNVVERTLNKFKKLSDQREFEIFDFICQEKFPWGSPKVITCTSVPSVA